MSDEEYADDQWATAVGISLVAVAVACFLCFAGGIVVGAALIVG